MDEHEAGKKALVDSGVFVTDPSDGLLVQRIIMQREWMRKLIESKGIKFVAMEAPYFSDWSTELLFALNQHLHEVFLNLDIFVVYFQPLTLKRLAVPGIKDSHDITKHHMIHQAKTELGLQGKRLSEHIADAYFAGKTGARFYKWYLLKELKDSDLSEVERDLFCGKHTFVKGAKKGLVEYTGIIYKENSQFFDYSKHKRKTVDITKEIMNAPLSR